MLEDKLAPDKVWDVEYGCGLFRLGCCGCGLKTRKRVNHVVTDYFSKDGSQRIIPLKAPWHRWCHDQLCRHDFCVGQRRRRQIDVFGSYIADVVAALENMIKTEDVPKFLSSPHAELDGRSPLQVIWHHDEWGFEKVMNIIKGVASGAFV